jgi:hypothetical protein
MRALLVTTAVILSLATQAPCAEELYAVGKYIPGPLITYSVSASGEIAERDVADELSWDYGVHIDRGGRLAFVLGNDALLTYRITPDRHLALASSIEAATDTGWWNHTGLSQDGRLALVLFADRGSGELHSEFQTYLVNNRLQIMPTGYALDADNLGDLLNWTISDRNKYTAILNLIPGFGILEISPSGEITDTGQRISTPWTHTRAFDTGSDGKWILAGQNIPPGIALYEVSSQGTVSLWDTFTAPDLTAVWTPRLWPNLRGVAVADGDGVMTVGLDDTMEFGTILDSETPSYGISNCVAVSDDSKMVLVDDQAPGFTFPLYSYFLSEDGQLTPTGYHLSRPDQHADLRFIRDPTPVTLPGDANCDGAVDVADAVFLINEALPDDKPILLPQNFANADLDNDVDVDEADFEALVEMLLNP